MEALAAIGLASNVFQFIDFALSLVSTFTQIHGSTEGSTAELLNLETVYDKLQECDLDLTITSSEQIPEGDPLMKQLLAIQKLALTARADCERLLTLVRELRIEHGSESRWKSTVMAIKTGFKGREIAGLDVNLRRTRATLTLHICVITSKYCTALNTVCIQLRSTSKAYHLEQHEQLENIEQMLEAIQARIEAAEPHELSDIDELAKQMTDLTLATRGVAYKQQVISSLGFPCRLLRHDSIPEAYHRTYEWVFHAENSTYDKVARKKIGVLKWMESGTGIFWVSGKPGSGKSTFMKFVADNQQTVTGLSKWAAPHTAIVASHYFWVHGTPIQKSRQGLLQTLLFELFRQHPPLIDAIYDKPWSAPSYSDSVVNNGWGLLKLQRLLRDIADRKDSPFRLCLFIDGVDDYDGDHALSEHILALSRSPHVKLCISSRGWNVFEDAFGQFDKLYMSSPTATF
ncbi:putative Nacht nucleoside triphosphatase [Seiridium unicorne]|uniref:Nacht nucleoside triphosphatase n=1 Tax=Seiridium unicorne TaxID=138068 RepID=A0ABR2UX25_9PEZI